jgi:predicted RNA-binding protein associated with RNAse of E/G family
MNTMQSGDPIRVEYIRPGKETTYYEEDLISLDKVALRTRKSLPEDIVASLSRALQRQGLIEPGQRTTAIRKTYFFTESFNLLEFCGPNKLLLGYYSDIGEPMIQLGLDTFQMTDLFLDIWLFPDGRLLELDWDEFEEAIKQGVITSTQADLARSTMQRLVTEAAQGIYPNKYLLSDQR